MIKSCNYPECVKNNFAHGYCQGHAAQIRRGSPLAPLRQPRAEAAEGFHFCSKCKHYRPEEDFGWDKTRNQFKRTCRPCAAVGQKKYYNNNAEKIRLQINTKKWGLTEEQYLGLFELQDHKCAICKAERREWRALAVDHNHETGAIRGLLCQDCNMGIGQLKDSIEILEAAISYLRSGGPLAELGLTVDVDALI